MSNIKNVKFLPKNEELSAIIPPPKPAHQYFPDFMRGMPSKYEKDNGDIAASATRCMPFMDTFRSGYIQELACDVMIRHHGFDENDRDIITYEWSGRNPNDFRPMSTRFEERLEKELFPEFPGYYTREFHWNSVWEPLTPPGYSTLYHHPFNRIDLPFYTLSGIIDTDGWPISGAIPFFIKRGFEGLIPAGTPIYQITFIKRDDWRSEVAEYDPKFQQSTIYRVKRLFENGYKREFWHKKNFS